ncbi:MAG TPA: hypothetical protein PK712_09650, partial [Rectinema sp.]|nr:hypothetical protein [Rectinema sp.]
MTQTVDMLQHELAIARQVLEQERIRNRLLQEQYRSKEFEYQKLETEYRILEEKHLTLVRKFFGKR